MKKHSTLVVGLDTHKDFGAVDYPRDFWTEPVTYLGRKVGFEKDPPRILNRFTLHPYPELRRGRRFQGESNTHGIDGEEQGGDNGGKPSAPVAQGRV